MLVEPAIIVIRTAVGLTMVVFGIHQMVNPKSWSGYLPESLRKRLSLPTDHFLRLHGFGNAVLGAIFALGLWPFILTWVVLAWWLSILPFAFYAAWDVGMRDLSIIGALAALLCLLWPVR